MNSSSSEENSECKKLLLTGFARTATLGTVKFNTTFGVWCYHQRCSPRADLRIMLYSFQNPPEDVKAYIIRKSTDIKGQRASKYFEASWAFANFIHLLQLSIPEIDFLISLRDPLYACSSLKRYMGRRISEEDCFLEYIFHYGSILRQIRAMKKKPKWIEFDDYVKGKYTKSFFDYFSIAHTDENFEKANEFLKTKINGGHEYPLLQLEGYIAAGRELMATIKRECTEF